MAVAILQAESAPQPAAEAVVRLGLIALATDLTIESDARCLLPRAAWLHVARVAYANPTTPANLAAMAPRLGAAARLLVPGIPLAAIGYGCTAASAVIGEDPVRAAIAEGRPGMPVCTPLGAAAAGCAALGVRRVALLTPYTAETTAVLLAGLEAAGPEVVAAYCLGMEDDRDMARLSEADILRAARAADRPQAEALFVSCTGVPAARLVPRLERALDKPVLTSNLALFWAMLRQAGLDMPSRHGRLAATARPGDTVGAR